MTHLDPKTPPNSGDSNGLSVIYSALAKSFAEEVRQVFRRLTGRIQTGCALVFIACSITAIFGQWLAHGLTVLGIAYVARELFVSPTRPKQEPTVSERDAAE